MNIGLFLLVLNGISMLNKFVIFNFLDEFIEFISCGIEITDSGIKRIMIHKVINILEHISTLRWIKIYFIEYFINFISDEDIALCEVIRIFKILSYDSIDILINRGDVVEINFHK